MSSKRIIWNKGIGGILGRPTGLVKKGNKFDGYYFWIERPIGCRNNLGYEVFYKTVQANFVKNLGATRFGIVINYLYNISWIDEGLFCKFI